MRYIMVILAVLCFSSCNILEVKEHNVTITMVSDWDSTVISCDGVRTTAISKENNTTQIQVVHGSVLQALPYNNGLKGETETLTIVQDTTWNILYFR